MFIDSDLEISASQALTATAVGTNVVDLSVARSVGSGEGVAVLFVVEVAADQTTGDEDYTFSVEVAASADLSDGETVGQRVFESGTPGVPAQDADLLVAGFQFAVVIPPISAGEDQRYLGVRYVLAGTTPTITVSAYVVPQAMLDNAKVPYSSGYSIT